MQIWTIATLKARNDHIFDESLLKTAQNLQQHHSRTIFDTFGDSCVLTNSLHFEERRKTSLLCLTRDQRLLDIVVIRNAP